MGKYDGAHLKQHEHREVQVLEIPVRVCLPEHLSTRHTRSYMLAWLTCTAAAEKKTVGGLLLEHSCHWFAESPTTGARQCQQAYSVMTCCSSSISVKQVPSYERVWGTRNTSLMIAHIRLEVLCPVVKTQTCPGTYVWLVRRREPEASAKDSVGSVCAPANGECHCCECCCERHLPLPVKAPNPELRISNPEPKRTYSEACRRQ